MKKAKSSFRKELKRDWQLVLMITGPVIIVILFMYLPMFGVLYSFQDVGIRTSFWENDWVGLKWFEQFFNSAYIGRYFKNTLTISISSLISSMFTAIFLALVVNEVKDGKFKRLAQSCTYFPNFISLTALIGMMTTMLDPNNGVLNLALQKWFGMQPTNFFMHNDYFLPLYVISGLWQGAGWSTIIYLGAITGIDPTLYEAAAIDGCGRLKRIWHITLQGMKPIIVLTMIMNIGSLLSVGHTKVMLMQTSLNRGASDIISTHVYEQGLKGMNFGYGTAVGFFNSLVNITLLIIANKTAKKLTETSMF